jgi:hypothetical protein
MQKKPVSAESGFFSNTASVFVGKCRRILALFPCTGSGSCYIPQGRFTG